MAKHNEVGKIGEDIAAKWLINNRHRILEQNFRLKMGEIDIVTRGTDSRVHFVEVKSVSYETREQLEYAVSHETWRPEENVHKEKVRRLNNAIQIWIAKNGYDGVFQIDVLTVRIVQSERFARVKLFENLIFD